MIDRVQAEAAFHDYTSQYEPANSMIRHKVDHTLRVADLCQRIAGSLGMDADEIDFAWFLGLLHDIGRFEQVRRYGTFIDSVSVDHADFGADILFCEKLIQHFPTQTLSDGWYEIAETAIRLHNKLALPDRLEDRTRLFCNLLRDADKVDIFRVVSELPFEARIGSGKALFQEADCASDAVMRCVYEHRCVARELRKSRFDGLISHCCMAFELVFDESRRIAREQGFLQSLMQGRDQSGQALWNDRERGQLMVLKREIEDAWGCTL